MRAHSIHRYWGTVQIKCRCADPSPTSNLGNRVGYETHLEILIDIEWQWRCADAFKSFISTARCGGHFSTRTCRYWVMLQMCLQSMHIKTQVQLGDWVDYKTHLETWILVDIMLCRCVNAFKHPKCTSKRSLITPKDGDHVTITDTDPMRCSYSCTTGMTWCAFSGI